MSDQPFLSFEDLEWSWEAKRPLFGWLPGDPGGYVWYEDREAAERAARKPFWRGEPFYRQWRLICRRVE